MFWASDSQFMLLYAAILVCRQSKCVANDTLAFGPDNYSSKLLEQSPQISAQHT